MILKFKWPYSDNLEQKNMAKDREIVHLIPPHPQLLKYATSDEAINWMLIGPISILFNKPYSHLSFGL